MAARHQRIATSLRHTAGSRAHLGATQYIGPYSLTDEHITPLQRLVDNIYFFPVSWRKLIVEFCRIQKPIKGNAHLTSMLLDLVDTTLSGHTSEGDLFQQYYEASNDCHDILDNMT